TSGAAIKEDPITHTGGQLNIMKELRKHLSMEASMPGEVRILEALRRDHPDCTVTQTPKTTGVLKLAKAGLASAELDTATNFYAYRRFVPPSDNPNAARRLKHALNFGKYNYHWDGHQFHVYVADYEVNEYTRVLAHYIVFPRQQGDIVDGQSQTVDRLIMAATQHSSQVGEEIWLYDRGYWTKSRKLWRSVQGCNWDDVILSPTMKVQLIGDIEGFFDREDDYKSFAVPWKVSICIAWEWWMALLKLIIQRGIILHGLPGNGKTISIKALMRSLYFRPQAIPTLYVKSLGRNCDQDDIRAVFEKARDSAPCLLVFEDIDSLVTDNVRSFFLNEVDGLEGNNGIMMIGSTNYLDRLDAGISKRPSRFDRKYHFALPAAAERVRYCEFWRTKLSKSSSIKLPSQAVTAIANITEGFSFAYLQEAFVTGLLTLVQARRSDLASATPTETAAPDDLDSNEVWQTIRKQVQTLRSEMKDSRKSVEDAAKNSLLSDARSSSAASTGFGLGSRP
ncbi:MAG: hypothetical protein Q9218_006472, partial [Villophora microphyllina]